VTSHGTARGRQRVPPGSREPPAVGYPSSTGQGAARADDLFHQHL